VNGICIILTLSAGELETMCLSTPVFVMEGDSLFDSFFGVAFYHDCCKVLHW
jgi:hypothetical protein